MKIARVVLLAAAVLACPLSSLARTAFLPTLDDVPAAPGLMASSGGGMVFETPEGRVIVVEAYASGVADAILAWYRGAMPALGWTVLPTPTVVSETATVLRFVRGGERLDVEASPATEPGMVRARFRFVSAPGAVSR